MDMTLAPEAPVRATAAMVAGMANASGDRALFRPSRMCYPGSKFGPKTRYDVPQRHKAYGNFDEAEAILFSGTALQQPMLSLTSPITTPRSVGRLGDVGRSLAMQPAAPVPDRNLALLDRPILGDGNEHGILVLGGKGAGKTALVISLLSAASGSYPSRHDAQTEEKRRAMPTTGQVYELGERDVRFQSGRMKQMKLLATDTPACGMNHREEQPLCTTVSPNSSNHFNAVPSWMRLILRGGKFPYFSVVFVVDATATPLWEDPRRCREIARMMAVLRRSNYTTVIAVTKLLKARLATQRDINYGSDHRGEVGKDPKSCYEAYVGRYQEKVCAAIRASAAENEWSFERGPDSREFPLTGVSIFDVPTYEGAVDYRKWQDLKATTALPNGKYISSQLEKVLLAASVNSHADLRDDM